MTQKCLYGLPIYPSALPRLSSVIPHLKILLMVDNVQQIIHLENFAKSNPAVPPWPIFIKVDVGSHRAGLETSSPSLPDLVKRVEELHVAFVYGFYCHAGHSYGCRTPEEAEKVLGDEVEGVVKAAGFLNQGNSTGQQRKVVVSVGSTPTAHVVKSLKENLPSGVELELHAGSFTNPTP